VPSEGSGIAYTFGIHPWFLNEQNHNQLLAAVENRVTFPGLLLLAKLALTGFEGLSGTSAKCFEAQIAISEELKNR